jgi:hypothetical protein
MTQQLPRDAAPRRRAQAEDAVAHALQEALRTSSPVTFASIAAAAGVSKDFIYRRPELRAQIDALRRSGRSPEDVVEADNPFAAESTVILRLSQQLVALRRQHRRETTELRRALAAAQGELLYLRRRLDVET